MAIGRKENGSLVKKAGKMLVDLALNLSSNRPVANSAVTAKFNQVDTDLSNKEDKWTKGTARTLCTFNNVATGNSAAITFKDTEKYLIVSATSGGTYGAATTIPIEEAKNGLVVNRHLISFSANTVNYSWNVIFACTDTTFTATVVLKGSAVGNITVTVLAV